MPDPVAIKYRAFISYSHADTRQVKWLHKRLEGFRIDKELRGKETAAGVIPKTLRPVFRDRHDFQAGHSLTDQTIAALDASAALVVLCSPPAAASEYVNEEIRLFRSRHPGRPVVPVILEGQPGGETPSPHSSWGEGRGEGPRNGTEQAAAPHPRIKSGAGSNPLLPSGEREKECFPPVAPAGIPNR